MNFLFANKLAFYIVNKTHSGKVNCDEVIGAMVLVNGLDDAITIDCIKFFFSLCDVDSDGFLDEKEFKHFLWCYNKCCDPRFVKIKADLFILLFTEMFRAIDSDMNGTVCCSEISNALAKLEKSNTTMFKYKDMFEDIKKYVMTKGPQTELSEFEFLCVSIKPEILFLHLEAKYGFMFKKIDKSNNGFIGPKDLELHILQTLFPRGCDLKSAISTVIYVVTLTTKSEKINLKQFGFVMELLSDVSGCSTYFTNSMLFESLFRLFDNNSNGEIEGEELVLLAETLKLSSKKKSIVVDSVKNKTPITHRQFIEIMQN